MGIIGRIAAKKQKAEDNKSEIVSKIENKIEVKSNNNSIIENKIIIKKVFKKDSRKKTELQRGYNCHLPTEYIEAIDALKQETGYYKDELARMAFELLFEKFGVEFVKE